MLSEPQTLLQSEFFERITQGNLATLRKSCRIQLPSMVLEVCSNSIELIQTLEGYFENVLCQDDPCLADLSIIAVDSTLPELNAPSLATIIEQIPWQDWQREPGKTGRKEACFDSYLAGQACRWILKVKTDMLFCQLLPSVTHNNQQYSFAWGPVNENPNQIINFMLTQFLNQQQRNGALLGHAAGLQVGDKGIAIAGLSGGGKSTLMLKLLEEGQHFVSNDRILLSPQPEGILMQGIPKQPRINPGTIVFNPRLHDLMTEAERQFYLAMPAEELRAHEEKYDADVNRFYWPNCYLDECALNAFVILNWQAAATHPTQITPTTLNARPDLVAALLKTPGIFYAPNGTEHFLANGEAPNPQAYLDLLGQVPCLEVTGNIDFEQAKTLVLQALRFL
ncbi:MAG: HprK-related kinase B [Thiotrichales bacterium]|nr:HprK-related kinase B [Thiotrichales bacterium]